MACAVRNGWNGYSFSKSAMAACRASFGPFSATNCRALGSGRPHSSVKRITVSSSIILSAWLLGF